MRKGRMPGIRPPDLGLSAGVSKMAYFVTSVRSLFRHLAADFAARIGRGVDVDIVLAGDEIGGLGVR